MSLFIYDKRIDLNFSRKAQRLHVTRPEESFHGFRDSIEQVLQCRITLLFIFRASFVSRHSSKKHVQGAAVTQANQKDVSFKITFVDWEHDTQFRALVEQI